MGVGGFRIGDRVRIGDDPQVWTVDAFMVAADGSGAKATVKADQGYDMRTVDVQLLSRAEP